MPIATFLINNAICNDGETTTTDLNNLLPAGISINGTWIDINNSGGFTRKHI
jgi:hypothetical protein